VPPRGYRGQPGGRRRRYRDYQTALQALALDPCINDLDTARAILDAYLAEQRSICPCFVDGGSIPP